MRIALLHITLVALLFSSCKKEEFNIQNLNGNKIIVQGHGGMGFSNLYPVNSLPSLINCLNIGADGSEMDVQLTNDSVLVLFHDHDLNVSTNKNGVIQNLKWSEIQSAYYTNVPYGNYSIVRLEDFLIDYTQYENRQFSFDIKLYSGDTDIQQYFGVFADRLSNLFNDYKLFDNVRIESQSVEFLNLLKEKNAAFQLYFYPQSFEEGFATVMENGFDGITISHELISTEQVDQAHSNGIFVTIWGTKTKKDNENAVRKNPDVIETDEVEHLVKLLQ